QREILLGQNVLARWSHSFSDASALQVQAYYDHAEFTLPGIATDDLRTYDLDLQHAFSWGTRQSIVWGGGYRLQYDDFPSVLSPLHALIFMPRERRLTLANAFVQDTVSLTPALKLTLGTKIEDEPYAGLEPLPSARLSRKISGNNLLWAAVARAVRAPSRIDRDVYEIVGPIVVVAGGHFEPETLVAYELGYRVQPTSRSSISVSTFYNVYDDLRSAEFAPGGQFPVTFQNRMTGGTYGVEIWGSFEVSAWWRLDAGANWLHKNLHYE